MGGALTVVLSHLYSWDGSDLHWEALNIACADAVGVPTRSPLDSPVPLTDAHLVLAGALDQTVRVSSTRGPDG